MQEMDARDGAPRLDLKWDGRADLGAVRRRILSPD
jgi:hypothetical protein